MKKTSLERVRELAAQPVATTDDARAITATAKPLDRAALENVAGGLRTANNIAA